MVQTCSLGQGTEPSLPGSPQRIGVPPAGEGAALRGRLASVHLARHSPQERRTNIISQFRYNSVLGYLLSHSNYPALRLWEHFATLLSSVSFLEGKSLHSPTPSFSFTDSRERGREGDRAGEKQISCLFHAPQLGTKPETQACAPTRNQTRDLSVCRTTPTHWATPARAPVPWFECFLVGRSGMLRPCPHPGSRRFSSGPRCLGWRTG